MMPGSLSKLVREHRFIQRVVGAMPAAVEKLESGPQFDSRCVDRSGEFLLICRERCHHGKGERHLFKLLETKGVPVRALFRSFP